MVIATYPLDDLFDLSWIIVTFGSDRQLIPCGVVLEPWSVSGVDK